jgi:hypothetical protein
LPAGPAGDGDGFWPCDQQAHDDVGRPPAIGNLIRGLKGRTIGGKMFQKNGEHLRSARWRVVTVEPERPI